MNAGGKFKLGAVQMKMSADPAENLSTARDAIREAAKRGAQVIVLPELFRSLYFCQSEDHAFFDLAEPIPGPSTQALGELAKKLGVVVVASLFERRAAGLYHNTAAIIDADGSIAGLYRKMHIPDDPLYYEKFYFTPGDLGFCAHDTRFGRLGTLVCWDQWFPEGARLTALEGATVLSYPTAIGWHPAEKDQHGAAQADAWRTIQRAHAIANGVYVAAVNRVGFEPGPAAAGSGVFGGGIEFFGGTFIADPFGVVLAEAGRTESEILVVEIDPAHQETVRRHWPFLRDRRVDAYASITARHLGAK
ncbi:MAG: carbon-nitrogen hydrolase [Deltaproteobacteria bacterium]|nr:carbon-nitrogen hydrolase [Deltaproteobacteria bacterium]